MAREKPDDGERAAGMNKGLASIKKNPALRSRVVIPSMTAVSGSGDHPAGRAFAVRRLAGRLVLAAVGPAGPVSDHHRLAGRPVPADHHLGVAGPVCRWGS